jgi:hypothetical protein
VEPISAFNARNRSQFGKPEVWKCEVLSSDHAEQHVGILNNFANAVLRGGKLLAPGEEGINGLTISNAIHLSTWTNDWVDLPIDEDLYHEKLTERVKTSTIVKKQVFDTVSTDISSTH